MSIIRAGPRASGTGEWFKEDEEDKEDTVRVMKGKASYFVMICQRLH